MTDLGTRRRLALHRATRLEQPSKSPSKSDRRSTMPTYAKALVAFITTALAQFAAILTGTASSFSDLTDGQWVTVAGASLVAAAAVYGVRNGISGDPTTSTPERTPDAGHSTVEVVLIAALVAVVVIVAWQLAT